MQSLILKIRNAGIGVVAAVASLLLISAFAWITHVIVCLRDGEWGFLIAGALAFPIAIVHGIWIWFGFW